MRQLEDAGPAIVRAGERALLVAEDLALEQRLGNRGAVDGDERERRARAQLVDGLRDELLARPRLAPDEHRRRRRRRLLDHAIERSNPGAVADDAAEAALLAQLAPQQLDLAQRLLPLDGLVQQDPQPLRIDRLAQVVVGAVLDRVDGALDRALRGQQDERDVRQLILQRAEQVVPAHPRHDQVAHDDGRPEAGDLAEAFLAVGRLVGLEAPGLDELGQPGPRGRVVLDDEHPLARGSRSWSWLFSSIVIALSIFVRGSVPSLGKIYIVTILTVLARLCWAEPGCLWPVQSKVMFDPVSMPVEAPPRILPARAPGGAGGGGPLLGVPDPDRDPRSS